jgi:hypothetical protein
MASRDGTVMPIEYKRGSPPDIPEMAYLPERAQVAAQVLVLRDAGYRADEGALYFAASKQRVRVEVDAALEQVVHDAIARARELAAREELPPPLDNSRKCGGCSLVGICLPDETRFCKTCRPRPRTTRRVRPARPARPADRPDRPERPAEHPDRRGPRAAAAHAA